VHGAAHITEKLGDKLKHLSVVGAARNAEMPTQLVDGSGQKISLVRLDITNGSQCVSLRRAEDPTFRSASFNHTAESHKRLAELILKNGPEAVQGAYEGVLPRRGRPSTSLSLKHASAETLRRSAACQLDPGHPRLPAAVTLTSSTTAAQPRRQRRAAPVPASRSAATSTTP
jgi:hypothetical protein